MQILGCLFVLSGLYLTIFLTEDDPREEDDLGFDVDTFGNSFKTLWKLITLNKQMKYLILFFLFYPVINFLVAINMNTRKALIVEYSWKYSIKRIN
jgi:hypothetical protein